MVFLIDLVILRSFVINQDKTFYICVSMSHGSSTIPRKQNLSTTYFAPVIYLVQKLPFTHGYRYMPCKSHLSLKILRGTYSTFIVFAGSFRNSEKYNYAIETR